MTDDPYRRARIIPNLIAIAALLLIVLIAMWNADAAQAARGLNGRCGMHIGSLVQRNSSGSEYHFRIGPKYPGTLRPGTCRGYVRVRISSPGSIGALAWQHYSMLHYKAKTTLLIAAGVGTVSGCTAAAKIMVSAISALVDGATEGVAFPGVAVAAGTIGCGVGAQELYSLLPDGPNNLDKVRMVK